MNKIKVIVANKWILPEDCILNPTDLFVFGDNLKRWGSAGQACIRTCTNAHGFATKHYPSMKPDSFFSDRDEELHQILNEEFIAMHDAMAGYTRLVLPMDGLGTGLSAMPEHCPIAFDYMNSIFSVLLGRDYPK